ESEKSPYFDIAQKHGVEIVFRPFIKVEGLSSREFRQQKINIADFTAVIFTAKIAVDSFFRLCEEMRITIPITMKYFCTSETIANYLQKYIVYRKRKIFASNTGRLSDLVPYLAKHKTEKFLWAVSDVNNGSESSLLESAKINFTRAALYRTVSNDFAPDEAFDYDMLVFFSPQGIDSLLKNFPDFKQDKIAIAALGPSTAKSVTDAGLRLDIQAPAPEAPSMPAAIDRWLTTEKDKTSA
ncbi:MAG: uroporphyrinogen-III synthase, partial [Muribaculaceae bacterium]